MAGKGGARIGAGRKSKAEELKVQNLAVSAIVAKYGSEEAGFKALLDSGESSLIKFAYEHAFGKPKESVEHSGSLGIIWNEKRTYEKE
jgi:hypothetical protein